MKSRGELYIRLGKRLLQIGEMQLAAGRQLEAVAPELAGIVANLQSEVVAQNNVEITPDDRIMALYSEMMGTPGSSGSDSNPGVNNCAALYLSVNPGAFYHKLQLFEGIKLLGAQVKSVESMVSLLSQDKAKRFKSDGRGGWALKTPADLIEEPSGNSAELPRLGE